MIPIIIIIALLVIIGFYLVSLYNRLVKLRNNRENAFADIDVQLKQRHDLIPQLVDAVKAYMKHEQKVLTDVTNARARAMGAGTIDDKIDAENMLTSALGRLQVAVEAYPDLKANQNFMNLQEEISDVENKLAASRRFFNSATREYNNSVETFPANMIANSYGFKREVYFEIGPNERENLEQAPKIDFEN